MKLLTSNYDIIVLGLFVSASAIVLYIMIDLFIQDKKEKENDKKYKNGSH